MPVPHRHLIIRAEVKNPFCKEDQSRASEWLKELVQKVGMKIVAGPIVGFAEAKDNVGITACVLIETSHISLHVWNEDNPPLTQLDVYSCSEFDINIVFDHMKIFEPTKIEYKFLNRDHSLIIL